jgi:hypothetical protein
MGVDPSAFPGTEISSREESMVSTKLQILSLTHNGANSMAIYFNSELSGPSCFRSELGRLSLRDIKDPILPTYSDIDQTLEPLWGVAIYD